MRKKRGMKVVSVHLPALWIELIDKAVEKKLFPNRAEFIRAAVRYLLMEVGDPEAD